tara:strand:+ start:341 stop:565 length:225 start_codon:yes stop_codon:yes gene_type:complete
MMEDQDYKIEKGIPKYNYWLDLTSQMEVGDSVLFPNRERSRMAVNALKAQGFKYTGQTVPGGYRIWREEGENAD